MAHHCTNANSQVPQTGPDIAKASYIFNWASVMNLWQLLLMYNET